VYVLHLALPWTRRGARAEDKRDGVF
jgi:hypothetical protein